MSIDVPTTRDFAELTQHRHPASVSIYVASWSATDGTRAPIVHDVEAARVALRSSANDALNQLEQIGISRPERDRISETVRELEGDPDLWATQGRTVAVFVSPETVRTFRLMNELPQHLAVGDRFDVGPLVRAVTFGHRGYVLGLTQGEIRLLLLESDATTQEIELPGLPAEAVAVLAPPEGTGRLDRHSAEGALGPKVEQRRFCSMVQDVVLREIGDATEPLVLAAAADLEPAYREVNAYPNLLEQGIDANPAGLSLEDLESRGRAVLEQHYADQLAAWREEFDELRARGQASSQLSDVARAATAGHVDTLLFDLGSTLEGHIDEAGALIVADEPGPTTYGLIDEIAVRVLRSSGTVRAVRAADLPDDSPVAATFRFAP